MVSRINKRSEPKLYSKFDESSYKVGDIVFTLTGRYYTVTRQASLGVPPRYWSDANSGRGLDSAVSKSLEISSSELTIETLKTKLTQKEING